MDAEELAEPASASEYVRRCRLHAGLTIQELAAKVGVSPAWLEAFEEGAAADELSYDLLLGLVRATEPPRPEGWDEGHEHDLHLGPAAVPRTSTAAAGRYWARIEAVRAANRSARGQA